METRLAVVVLWGVLRVVMVAMDSDDHVVDMTMWVVDGGVCVGVVVWV